MDWPDEPASEQQVMHLKNLGVSATPNLTMTAAARLIRQLRQAGPAASSRPLISASSWRASGQANEGDHALSPRNAGQTTNRTGAATPQISNAAAEPAATMASRVEFWLDTCRDIREMQVASVKVYEFHHSYGYRWLAPTSEQAQEILDALDAAIPSWENDHPELFYKTLELNYPTLIRPVQSGAKRSSF